MRHEEIIVGHFDGALFSWHAAYVKKILARVIPLRVYTQPFALADRSDAARIMPHMHTSALGASFDLPASVVHAHIIDETIDCAALPLEILPLELPYPLIIAGIVGRTASREAFVSRSGKPFREMPPGSRVGIFCKRQHTQAAVLRGDLAYSTVTPDAETLIGIEGMRSVDAVFYPEADLRRLSYDRYITELMPEDAMLGALRDGIAVIVHRENRMLIDKLAPVIDAPTRRISAIEDAFMRDFNPPYDAPFAGRITITGPELRFSLRAIDEATLRMFEDEYVLIDDDPHAFGRDCAARFERKGGRSPLSKHR